MKRIAFIVSVALWVPGPFGAASASAAGYRNFKVAVYSRAYETREMGDPAWLEPRWNELTRQVQVDKIYLETHRDLIIVDEAILLKAKKFFADRGVRTAGGITLTVNERNRFETFCYSNPEHRKKVREIIEYTAKHFDEVILDDFYFTSCKCDLCIAAKGTRSWTQYRLELLDSAARELVIGPAKAVNPRVKMVIKYPNWYEHFQGLGFNLETEPKMFDGIYTGTETRDAVNSGQHLQQYLGHQIFRYFENIKPGGNGGGWVDTGGMRYMDRYAEQLWITLFAKAPEITLFDIRQLQRPLRQADRSAWQDAKPSFDFDEMMQPIAKPDGTSAPPTTIARAAGYVFEQVDRFLGELGKPVGLKSYKPFHSTGEDFLHTYLGMIGVPTDLEPEFPTQANTVFLAETAKADPELVAKIKKQLIAGKRVVITSGLLRALQGKGIEDIVELDYTGRKIATRQFMRGFFGTVGIDTPIHIPQIQYLTNDAWELIGCITENTGYPMLIQASYSKGLLYVLVIPDDVGDLYRLPPEVLGQIREVLTRDLFVRLDGPAMISLFPYDNNAFIVESFLPESVEVGVIAGRPAAGLRDLVSGEVLTAAAAQASASTIPGPPRSAAAGPTFRVGLKPHSYRVFRLD